MFCSNCGAQIPDAMGFCPNCGRRVTPAPVASVASPEDQVELRLGNLVDTVLKRHRKGEADELFACGGPSSTPNIASVSRDWPHPWVYSRVFLVLLITFAGLWTFSSIFENPNGYPGLMFIGALLVPFSVVVFFFETNVPRNLSFARVIEIFFVGGVLSLLCIYPLGVLFPGSGIIDFGPAMLTGVVEELAKVAATAVFVKRIGNRNYVLTGMLVGAAVGAGFAVFETAGYIFNYGFMASYTWAQALDNMMDVTVQRSVLAVGGHVAWAAVEGGALALADKDTGFKVQHLWSPAFLGYLAVMILLHGIWDTLVPVADDVVVWNGISVKYVLLVVAVWVAIVVLIRRGIAEVNQLSAEAARAQWMQRVAAQQAAGQYPVAQQAPRQPGYPAPQGYAAPQGYSAPQGSSGPRGWPR